MTNQPGSDELLSVASDQIDVIRKAVKADAWIWCKVVCGHTELSPWFHRPLAYLLDGDAEKLVQVLNNPLYQERSYSAREIGKRLKQHYQVDWNSFAGFQRLIELLDFVSLVAYRGSAKSTLGHDLDAKAITLDPDDHTLIVSASDDRAMTFSKQIRDTINSPLYKILFPERVPDDPKDLTESAIKLKGRRLGKSPQPSLEARGYTSRIAGAHYGRFSVDDLLIDTNVYDVEGVYRFLLGMAGLYEPRRIVRRHYHTVYHERGDQWLLANTPNCFQLVVPIEYYEGDQPEDLSLRGIPTNPDWHDAEKVKALYEQIIADDKEGPRSYRMNFLLDPSAGGGAVFPAAIVDDRVWQWVEIIDKASGQKQKAIGRPLYDKEGKRVKAAENHKALLPRQLSVVIGVDQAISDLESADEWSVCGHATDTDGMEYILKTLHGHGLEQMLDAIMVLDRELTLMGLKPRRIGLEKAGFQGATKKWIESDRRFAQIKSRVVDIKHSGVSKEIVLQNAVAEPMKSRRFFTAAHDQGCKDGREQAKGFKPFTKKRRDDILDSWAIASAAAKRPADKQNTDERLRKLAAIRRERTDPTTGIYLGG